MWGGLFSSRDPVRKSLTPFGDHPTRQGWAEAKVLLWQCIEQGRLRIGKHFRELRADNFDINQALSVMRSGNVYDAPECDIKTGEWKYQIEGYEPDGRCIASHCLLLQAAIRGIPDHGV
jgi:hypothetical protein